MIASTTGSWKTIRPTSLDRLPADSYSFVGVIKDIAFGEQCFFRVRSRNDVGWSDWSDPSPRIVIGGQGEGESSAAAAADGSPLRRAPSRVEDLTDDERKLLSDKMGAQREVYVEKRALKVRVLTHNVGGEKPTQITSTQLQALCCGGERDADDAHLAEHLPLSKVADSQAQAPGAV